MTNDRKAPLATAMLLAASLLLLTRAAYQTSDSLSYAASASSGLWMFHPHHLLFTPIVRIVFLGVSAICVSCDAVFAAQVHNVLWAIVAATCVYHVVVRLRGSARAALIAAGILLVSRSFWEFATQAEVYVPATGALALVLAIVICKPSSLTTVAVQVVIGFCFALAIFYHQTSVLFAVPLAFYALAVRGRQGLLGALTVLAVAAAVVIASYAAVVHAVRGQLDLRTFVRFCLDYVYFPEPDWGTSRHFGVDGVRKLLFSQLESFIFIPDGFARMANRLWAPFLLFLLAWSLGRVLTEPEHRGVRGALVLWVFTHFAFFLWWLPGEKEFFITSSLPIILLGVLFAGDLRDALRGRGAATVVAAVPVVVLGTFFVLNLRSTILPLHRSKGEGYGNAVALARTVPERCLILTDRDTQMNLRYYFNRDRVANFRVVLLRSYHHQPITELHDWGDAPCVFASWWQLAPALELGGTNGYRQRDEWSKVLEWLLGIETDADRRAVRCRRFSVVRLETGAAYISITGDKLAVNGLEDVLPRLDRELSEAGGSPVTAFSSWLSRGTDSSGPRRDVADAHDQS